jgi:hypothetical protein
MSACGTSRRFVAKHQFGRYWRHSGHGEGVASRLWIREFESSRPSHVSQSLASAQSGNRHAQSGARLWSLRSDERIRADSEDNRNRFRVSFGRECYRGAIHSRDHSDTPPGRVRPGRPPERGMVSLKPAGWRFMTMSGKIKKRLLPSPSSSACVSVCRGESRTLTMKRFLPTGLTNCGSTTGGNDAKFRR